MRWSQLVSLIAIAQCAQAWPWPPTLDKRFVVPGVEALFKRQNTGNANTNTNNGNGANTNTANANTNTDTNAPAQTAGSAATNANANPNSATITNGPQGTGSVKASPTVKANSTSIDARLPAGGISMITPNPILGATYYKIGDWVTFAWNYTSLSVTPSAINIVASCSVNQQIYTIAANQSVEPTGGVLWDTSAYQANSRNKLLTNEYTLIVYDAASQISATPRPGYLGSYNGFQFGMYQPEPYQNWTSFHCPTCSGAASLERMTLSFLFGMVGITVLSFTWFVSSLA